MADYLDNDYVNTLITNNLKSFFVRSVSQYDYKNYPIRFVGSVASTYSELLREVGRNFGVEIDVISESLMDGLVEFHAMNIDD